MTAPAVTVRLESPAPPGGGDAAFVRRVKDLERLYAERWRETDEAPPVLGAPVPRERQRDNARAAERLLADAARRCEEYPDREDDRRAWREEVREIVRRFGEERLGWPEGYRSLLFAESFYDTTVRFVREARRFDSEMKAEDVGQALRNVWIMNSLQLLLDRTVGFAPAIFGYSMLYPCTDNLLDDPAVSPETKAAFNRSLGLRLSGAAVLPRSTHEQKAFALVERIEAQYSRPHDADVFHSLLAIHRAQEDSLAQQRGDAALDAETLLRITVGKGGASLLADGYLVAGELRPEEAELCFGYGVFLQLLDDLQDCRADAEAGHATLFTRRAAQGPLDPLVGRLHRFMHRVLEESPRLAGRRYAARKDLILRNCTALLVSAVGEQPERFTPPFRRGLEERWPVDFASMTRLLRRAARRGRRAARVLCRRKSVDSPLALL
jgi:hypothetical protein